MSEPPVNDLKALLHEVAKGRITPAEAEVMLRRHQVEELGFATVDLQRQARRGRPEVVYSAGKAAGQIVAIARAMAEAGQNVLMTRIDRDKSEAVARALPDYHFDERPGAGLLHLVVEPIRRKQGVVAVLAAGTSDLPVAEEAASTAELLGSTVERAYDVGVAGLHRLLKRADLLVRARVVIAVAGMEGALPSVVGGLVGAPVIAVPTSVGYGANFQGLSALLTMLNSCSSGVSVVNIDNGFGAGYMADTINGLGELEG